MTIYNPATDPSILNEFATVAYRFGHSTVSDRFNGNGGWPLRFHFLQSQDAFVKGTTGSCFSGSDGTCWMNEMKDAIDQISPKNDLIVGDALRYHLFRPPHLQPEDLVARNIQRGREHGIPTYGALRIACGLSPLSGGTPPPPPPEINQANWNKLLLTYSSAEDIDAFTGGLAEDASSDGIVGPLFACIIGDQFRRLRDGDRYFYTHGEGNNARGLEENTRGTVLDRTLGHIICDNTDAESTQRNVFKETGENNNVENCGDLDGLDFDSIVKDILGTYNCLSLLLLTVGYFLSSHLSVLFREQFHEYDL